MLKSSWIGIAAELIKKVVDYLERKDIERRNKELQRDPVRFANKYFNAGLPDESDPNEARNYCRKKGF